MSKPCHPFTPTVKPRNPEQTAVALDQLMDAAVAGDHTKAVTALVHVGNVAGHEFAGQLTGHLVTLGLEHLLQQA